MTTKIPLTMSSTLGVLGPPRRIAVRKNRKKKNYKTKKKSNDNKTLTDPTTTGKNLICISPKANIIIPPRASSAPITLKQLSRPSFTKQPESPIEKNQDHDINSLLLDSISSSSTILSLSESTKESNLPNYNKIMTSDNTTSRFKSLLTDSSSSTDTSESKIQKSVNEKSKSLSSSLSPTPLSIYDTSTRLKNLISHIDSSETTQTINNTHYLCNSSTSDKTFASNRMKKLTDSDINIIEDNDKQVPSNIDTIDKGNSNSLDSSKRNSLDSTKRNYDINSNTEKSATFSSNANTTTTKSNTFIMKSNDIKSSRKNTKTIITDLSNSNSNTNINLNLMNTDKLRNTKTIITDLSNSNSNTNINLNLMKSDEILRTDLSISNTNLIISDETCRRDSNSKTSKTNINIINTDLSTSGNSHSLLYCNSTEITKSDINTNSKTTEKSFNHFQTQTENEKENQNNNNNSLKKKQKNKKDQLVQPFEVNGVPYLPLDVVGRGGSAVVYKVVGPDRKIYALKHIPLDKKRNHGSIRTYLKEIEYLELLKGKNHIIHLVDSQENTQSNQNIYMVLEFGEIDLSKMIQNSGEGLQLTKLRLFWEEMLKAVQTIHQSRIIHGDLKPANFLLVKGVLKLIDFGIAEILNDDETHIIRNSMIGTMNYMPPEAFLLRSSPKKEQDQDKNTISDEHFNLGIQSDVWSLGCILYQMAFGHTPFQHYNNVSKKVAAILNQKLKINIPTTDNDLRDVLVRCLERDRSKRPSILNLLQHPFLTRTNNSLDDIKEKSTLSIKPSQILEIFQLGHQIGLQYGSENMNLKDSPSKKLTNGEFVKITKEVFRRIKTGASLKLKPSDNFKSLKEDDRRPLTIISDNVKPGENKS